MATYDELYALKDNTTMLARVAVACVIAAEAIRTEATSSANHLQRVRWAARVFADPVAEAARMWWAVLAQNKAATSAQITGATDATIQTAVAAAVDVFAVMA
jgi:hypothetical protein